MEALLTIFPQSESSAHVGAWSPWATTGLVLLAGLIAKFHASVAQSVSMFVRRACSRCKAVLMEQKGASKASRGEVERRGQDVNFLQPVSYRSKGSVDVDASKTPAQSVMHRIVKGLRAVKEEWVLLRGFWHDPDGAG